MRRGANNERCGNIASFSIDLEILVTVGSLLIGLAGFFVAYVSLRFTHRETRLQCLTEILNPFFRGMQLLYEANNCRRKTEKLKRAYAGSDHAPEAVERINENVERYGELSKAAQLACKAAESEWATRKFRFPDKLARMVADLKNELFRLGEYVGDGQCDKADLQLARVTDLYNVVTAYARGWRLSDPCEFLLKRIRRAPAEDYPATKSELTEEQMARIDRLIRTRFTSQAGNAFTVHPPQKLLNDDSIAVADDVIEQLEDSIFEVVFQDGTNAMLTLTELLMFVYQVMFISAQSVEVAEMIMPSDIPTTVEVKVAICEPDLMRPELVKALLSKIEFSNVPSELQ